MEKHPLIFPLRQNAMFLGSPKTKPSHESFLSRFQVVSYVLRCWCNVRVFVFFCFVPVYYWKIVEYRCLVPNYFAIPSMLCDLVRCWCNVSLSASWLTQIQQKQIRVFVCKLTDLDSAKTNRLRIRYCMYIGPQRIFFQHCDSDSAKLHWDYGILIHILPIHVCLHVKPDSLWQI